MARDERIFRVVKQGYRGEKIKYATRTAVSAMFGAAFSDPKRPDIIRVEAIDPASIPWDDVTDEFRNRPAPAGCYWHKDYTGVRKPTIWSWSLESTQRFLRCTCTVLYLEKHPDYPRHNLLCSNGNRDPAACECRVLNRLLD